MPRNSPNRRSKTAPARPQRQQRQQRPQDSLGPEQIIAASLIMARKMGFGGLSMRRIAAKLDVTATALYHHFRNKNELLDGVGGHIMDSLVMPDPRLPWTRRLRDLILLQQQTLMTYPGLARFSLNHRESAPALRWMEMILEVLHNAGFRGTHASRALFTLAFFVNPLALLDDRPHPGRNLMLRRKRIESRTRLNPQRYPRLVELLPSLADYPYDSHLPIALDRIIAGLADELATITKSARAPIRRGKRS